MTDHLPNCYRNQTMGHYGGGPADCDCGAARRPSVKSASMTDAADKAREIVKAEIKRQAEFGMTPSYEDIAIAVLEAERERAGKLVDAAKEVVPAINASEDLSNRKRDAFKAALAAYDEVQP